MEPRIFRYIGGSSEMLHTPLNNGLNFVQRGVDIVVTDHADARRLKASPNKYQEVTPESKAKAKAPTARKEPVASPEEDAN